ncbi:hypothetical protein GCM10023328_40620 [Modestobacter marinus]|uniref:DUF4123 domain-containing protein n=1 Tax=Modestobacter marinus TaxID=477641 RepID=A0A846LSP0_9ACTN|nr:hypothetical protein [Modestobacter marinus]NIH68635.1 hypothetical protein [Modestobacter marinus]GGL58861.1 hypothetical protein GCM10011589_13570 [Modestobacter marinus]
MDDHIERVPGFPACRLFALVDSDAALRGALSALAPYVQPGAARVLSGEPGIRALDVDGRARGTRGRLLRAVQDVSHGRGALALHEEHLRRGGHLLLVPARDWAQCRRLVDVLGPWRAHGLVWFARYSVVDVTPRYCAHDGRALVAA